MTVTSVYLDYNASTPLLPRVEKSYLKASHHFGNPSSFHRPGNLAKELVEESRVLVLDFLGADTGQLIFTGSGTEANN